MSELIDFALENLLSQLDELTISVVPRSSEDLSEYFRQLQSILREFGDFVRFVENTEHKTEE